MFPAQTAGKLLLLTRHLPQHKDDQISVMPLEIANMSYNTSKAWEPLLVLLGRNRY